MTATTISDVGWSIGSYIARLHNYQRQSKLRTCANCGTVTEIGPTNIGCDVCLKRAGLK